ncbi:MAG: hypothetical protein JJLCMIEE_00924 [Acidimicrobiales bacterium]|nr:hypothetical protein [Acidimicrobiales bacterium]
MAETEVVQQPSTSDVDEEEGDRLAHIGRAEDVTRAYVTGEVITALCGKRFVPTRDPSRYPVCEPCKQLLDRLKAGRTGMN